MVTDSSTLSNNVSPEENLDTNEVAIQVDKLSDRQRQISATIQIPQPVEKVWQILTDYESLPDFIPNLAKSTLLEHPNGGIRLEQIGRASLLNLRVFRVFGA
jgi:hypothetical protein